MQVRQHKQITEKQLKQPFFYLRWYYCLNRKCKTKQVMPDEFIIYNKNKKGRKQKSIRQMEEEIRRQEEHIIHIKHEI